MKKYYIGLLVLAAVTVGLLVFTISSASDSGTDKKTSESVTTTVNKLNSYITTNNLIPESLPQAGVSNSPSSITYTKISSSQFKFCATYLSASNGFDAGWTALLGGALSGESSASYTPPEDTTYLSTTVTYYHKKGANCQTVKPYIRSQVVPPSDIDFSKCYDGTTITPACQKLLQNQSGAEQ